MESDRTVKNIYGDSSVLHCTSLLRINLHVISARAALALKKDGGFFFTASLVREVNRRFLVNKHGDLSIFSLFLSLLNAYFLYSEHKQISIVKNM